MGKRNRRGALDAMLLSLAVACAAIAAFMAFSFVSQDAAYEGLSEQAAAEGHEGIDWDALLAQNPDTAGWLEVRDTRIDYPVVKPGAGKAAGWYLRHDFWGNQSPVGCLYLDDRCEADGRHALVYGHHLGLSGQMFSDIYDAYGQERFDGIGAAEWTTPGNGAVEFEPLMAMSVDKSYGPVQRFDFETVGELRAWLGELGRDATAKADGFDALAGGAARALTLVTCSSPWSGQRARTLLVFVA